MVLTNWRGVVAPGSIDDAQRAKLTDLVTKLHDSEAWKATLAKNNWDDAFLAGDEFKTSSTEDIAKVKTTLTRDRPGQVTMSAQAQTTPARRPTGRSSFALVFVSVGARGPRRRRDPFRSRRRRPASARGPSPTSWAACWCCAAPGVVRRSSAARSGRPRTAKTSTRRAKTDWVALAKLVGFVVLHIFLIEPAGWPVAAAVLFSGAAWSLDAKPLWKAIAVSVILALVLQYVFGGLLGVSLPPRAAARGGAFLHG